MWPLFIELIVNFYVKITGKIFVTQGKLRENTGNFILTRMWPPCSCLCWLILFLPLPFIAYESRRAHIISVFIFLSWRCSYLISEFVHVFG